MTDIYSNSPLDICAHVIYDAYQHVSTEKSYSNYEKLCITFGKEAISYEEYDFWFKEYSKKTGRNLPDIRGCILSDVTNGKSAEKSFDDLCDAFNNHRIDKEDHDYWYKRFGSGHFSQVTFSDFPEDVVVEIVGKCDIKSYLELRIVSHGLRTFIDQLKPHFRNIQIHIWPYQINLSFNDVLLEYFHSQEPEVAFEELKFALRNPKLQLKTLDVVWYRSPFRDEIVRRYTKMFDNLLNSLNHKIHVEHCSISAEEEERVISVLKCLKPGTLEMVTLTGGLSHENDQISTLEQWKQAKHAKIGIVLRVPIKHLSHFTTFEVDTAQGCAERNSEFRKIPKIGSFSERNSDRNIPKKNSERNSDRNIPKKNFGMKFRSEHSEEKFSEWNSDRNVPKKFGMEEKVLY